MSKKPHANQLDLFAPVAGPLPLLDNVAAEAAFIAKLVAAGLCTFGEYALNSGHLWHPLLRTDQPLSKSRLIKFPMQCHAQRVYLVHPALQYDAWVSDVSAKLRYRPRYDDCVAQRRKVSEWHHATDLCTKAGHAELIATLHFTRPECVADAVASGLRYGWSDIDAKIARRLLEAAGISEPAIADPDEIIRRATMPEWHFRDEKPATAWMHVHGLETGVTKRGKKPGAGLVPVKERSAA